MLIKSHDQRLEDHDIQLAEVKEALKKAITHILSLHRSVAVLENQVAKMKLRKPNGR